MASVTSTKSAGPPFLVASTDADAIKGAEDVNHNVDVLGRSSSAEGKLATHLQGQAPVTGSAKGEGRAGHGSKAGEGFARSGAEVGAAKVKARAARKLAARLARGLEPVPLRRQKRPLTGGDPAAAGQQWVGAGDGGRPSPAGQCGSSCGVPDTAGLEDEVREASSFGRCCSDTSAHVVDVVQQTQPTSSSQLPLLRLPSPLGFEPSSFDRILLDAPCSALGLRPRLLQPATMTHLWQACRIHAMSGQTF
jgi:hypothetical protein